MPSPPSLGRILLYSVTAEQSAQVNRRRTDGKAIAARMKLMVASDTGEDEVIHGWPAGAQAHIGEPLEPGELVPLIVTKVFEGGTVNGQAFLEGNDVLWVIAVNEGTGPGTWQWPPRV